MDRDERSRVGGYFRREGDRGMFEGRRKEPVGVIFPMGIDGKSRCKYYLQRGILPSFLPKGVTVCSRRFVKNTGASANQSWPPDPTPIPNECQSVLAFLQLQPI